MRYCLIMWSAHPPHLMRVLDSEKVNVTASQSGRHPPSPSPSSPCLAISLSLSRSPMRSLKQSPPKRSHNEEEEEEDALSLVAGGRGKFQGVHPQDWQEKVPPHLKSLGELHDVLY